MSWMRMDPRAEEVREIVRETFCDLSTTSGLAVASWIDLEETIRIGQGRCLNRCYAIDGFSAIWQVAEGIVEFYDAQGRLMKRMNLLKKVQPQRVAA